MRFLVVLAAAAAFACGSGSSSAVPGSATFSGTVHGQAFTAVDATSAEIQGTNTSNQQVRNAVVILSSAPAICSLLGASKEPKSTQYLLFVLADLSGGAAPDLPKGPGTFPIAPSGPRPATIAGGTFFATDTTCSQVSQSVAAATSGTVTLTAVGSTYAGSFDVVLASTDHVTGTFTAPGCPGLANFLQSGAPTTCQ